MIKKSLILLSCAMSVSMAIAQVDAYEQTNGGVIDGYTLPRTVLNVVVTQEREVLMRGPYARYASQYLGIIGAAQTDKQIYRVLDVQVLPGQEPDPQYTYFFDSKSGVPTKVFSWLKQGSGLEDSSKQDVNFDDAKLGNQNPFHDVGATIFSGVGGSLSVERTSSVAKNPEQMAAEAAATIFKIRQKRIEIICAEQGENVFGAGLEAALKEMDRLENEYLSLFVGKRYTQVTKKVFSVVPELGQNRVVACRFSIDKGVVDASDVSASPINVELAVSKDVMPIEAKSNSRMMSVRVPKMVTVKVVLNDAVLDTERVAVYQFGEVIKVPII